MLCIRGTVRNKAGHALATISFGFWFLQDFNPGLIVLGSGIRFFFSLVSFTPRGDPLTQQLTEFKSWTGE